MAFSRNRIRLKVKCDVDALKVWDTVTNPIRLAIWFCNSAEINPKLRGTVKFSGNNCVARTFEEQEIKGVITALEPNRLLKFTWPLNGSASEVTWRLDDMGRYTDFLVTHEKLPPGAGMMDAWHIYLYNLQALLHTNRPVYRCDYNRIDKGTIKREVFIETVHQPVYKALTRQKELRRWFSETAEVEAPLQPGSKYSAGWVNAEGNSHGPQEIKEAVENKKLIYSWKDEAHQAGDTVSWELTRIGERTRVNLRHTGFPDGMPQKDYMQGWHSYILLLKDYCENGGQLTTKIIEKGTGE
jgi:uncharacterized protein YndB with AHSA1/START domain